MNQAFKTFGKNGIYYRKKYDLRTHKGKFEDFTLKEFQDEYILIGRTDEKYPQEVMDSIKNLEDPDWFKLEELIDQMFQRTGKIEDRYTGFSKGDILKVGNVLYLCWSFGWKKIEVPICDHCGKIIFDDSYLNDGISFKSHYQCDNKATRKYQETCVFNG